MHEKLKKKRGDSGSKPEMIKEAELALALAESKHASLLAAVNAEKIEDDSRKETEEWKEAARDAVTSQRKVAVLDARMKLQQAQTARAAAQAKSDETRKTFDT